MRLDCVGIPVCAYARHGIALPDRTDYGNPPPASALAAALREAFGAPVGHRIEDAFDADVVLLVIGRTRMNRAPIHCGLVDGRGFWHVLEGGRVEWQGARGAWSDAVHEVYGFR